MKKSFSYKWFIPLYILLLLDFSLIANIYWLNLNCFYIKYPALFVFLFLTYLIKTRCLVTKNKRLKRCFSGVVILAVFEISVFISAIYHIVLAFMTVPHNWTVLLWSALWCILFEAVFFWCGIIIVYLNSVQLGIKIRVIGVICGMIPIANQIVLHRIIKTVFKEVIFETEKERINSERKEENLCRTKYPILFVHGVFFRDSKYLNYWGRIPKELVANGATVYYGNHQSAASIADSAAELTERIKFITKDTGCEKVNIIAHSKGGLDCRYAIAKLGAAPYVASLTTINTPHRGCIFADYLLTKIPVSVKNKVASVYNSTLKNLGDSNPDFLAAVNDLTAPTCIALDREMTCPKDIYCQSVGSRLDKSTGGKLPLNFTYHLVKYFDGPNDGLVGESSFAWGENFTLLTPDHKRGISHADMIDLNRENIEGFDVREFYVDLVNALKNRGL
ncbi:MAG: triacylglycerol lipase [Clostridia bacterium]|nr:triacylglycerol lipase [Clostridia bacterium]